jgi:hypothetical protein
MKRTTRFLKLLALTSFITLQSEATTPSLCENGLCEVFSISTQGRAEINDATNSSPGNITILDPGNSNTLTTLNCRVSALVPREAWSGLKAMFESVKGLNAPPNDLNNAQQVMILFYSSIQEMLKEFSCDRAAAQWK